MPSSGDALRRQAEEARAFQQRADAVARSTAHLQEHLRRLGGGIHAVIGGTATGEDRRLQGLLQAAERSQRAAGAACHDAASAAGGMASRLEAEARAADARNDAERARKK